MGKINYTEYDGYYFTSDEGIRYNLYEGLTMNGENRKRSDTIFIVLDDYEEVNSEVLGMLYGADSFEEDEYYRKDLEEDINYIVNRYEATHPSTIKEIRKGHSFADDEEKMVDFLQMPKWEFLTSYSYLSEKDYDETVKEVARKIANTKKAPTNLYDELCSTLTDFENCEDNDTEDGYLSDGEWLDIFYNLCVKLQRAMN